MTSHLALRGASVCATGVPRARYVRLGIAASAALALHAGVLLFKPKADGSSHVVASRVIALRLLAAHLVDPPAPRVEPEALPLPSPRSEQTNAASLEGEPRSQDVPRAHLGKRAPMRPVSAAAAPAALPVAQPSSPIGGLAPAPNYLLGAQLDPGPRPLADIEPEYPEAANLQEGMVVLRVLINEAGVVDDVAVVKADPKGVFDNAAVEAFKAARFSPGMVLGTPVKSQITVQVDFVPINRGARISGRMY